METDNIDNYPREDNDNPFGSVFSFISFRAILEQIRQFFIIFKYPIFQLKSILSINKFYTLDFMQKKLLF